jgi:hypothetical protein
MVLHLPHSEGGYGVSSNDITKDVTTFSKVSFGWTTGVFKQPHFLCYILYIEQWEVHYIKLRGCCTSFHHGHHTEVGMVSYAHVVYVTCYFYYMFSLGPSSGRTGSVRIYRSTRDRYTPNIYRCIPR